MANIEHSITPNSIYSMSSGSCLHISSLPFETTEEDVLFLFKDYGVQSVKVFK
jgi:hypothetical protein